MCFHILRMLYHGLLLFCGWKITVTVGLTSHWPCITTRWYRPIHIRAPWHKKGITSTPPIRFSGVTTPLPLPKARCKANKTAYLSYMYCSTITLAKLYSELLSKLL